jgi:mRNA interferase MazF
MKGFTMTIQPGKFWVADIHFTNGIASKKRPVLVLWLDGNGLQVASTVLRLSRLVCLTQSLLLGRIGLISQSDAAQAKEIWQLHIKPQF